MSNNLISGERLMKIADLCIVEKECLPNLLNGIDKYIEVGYGGQDPNMTIPLNTNLVAGDVIDCVFPRLIFACSKARDKKKEFLE